MSVKIKELPESERPYEKMEMYGASTLSNSELLAIIIKCGTKEDTSVTLAQKILNLKGINGSKNLNFLQELSIQELTTIKGIGKVKAIQIIATCELAKRMSKPVNSLKIVIKDTNDVVNLLMNELKYEKREVAKLLILDSKKVLLRVIDIALGGGNFAIIEPKIILKEPVQMGASSIILVHNHPSGNPTPSEEDIRMTDRIYESADVMGITLLDHVIIGNNTFASALRKQENRKSINAKENASSKNVSNKNNIEKENASSKNVRNENNIEKEDASSKNVRNKNNIEKENASSKNVRNKNSIEKENANSKNIRNKNNIEKENTKEVKRIEKTRKEKNVQIKKQELFKNSIMKIGFKGIQ